MMRRLWLLLLPIVLLFAGCDDETAYSYVGYYNVTMELYAVVRDANGVDHTVRASDKGEMYLDFDDVDGYVYTEGFINTTGYVDDEGCLLLDPSTIHVEMESVTLPDMEADVVLQHSVTRHNGWGNMEWSSTVTSQLRDYEIVSATVNYRAVYLGTDSDDDYDYYD